MPPKPPTIRSSSEEAVALTVYDDLPAFYAADPRRARSGEADFGVWWREQTNFPVWRVSWVKDTGEVYAICLLAGITAAGRGAVAIAAGYPTGRVEVLGVIPADPNASVAYAHVEAALTGWGEECGKPHSLTWVRERIAAADQQYGSEEEMR